MDEAYKLVSKFMRDKFNSVSRQYTAIKECERAYISSAETLETGRAGLMKIYKHHLDAFRKYVAGENGDEMTGKRIELVEKLMVDLDRTAVK